MAHGEVLLIVIPTPFVERTMARIKDRLRDDQVRQRWACTAAGGAQEYVGTLLGAPSCLPVGGFPAAFVVKG